MYLFHILPANTNILNYPVVQTLYAREWNQEIPGSFVPLDDDDFFSYPFQRAH